LSNQKQGVKLPDVATDLEVRVAKAFRVRGPFVRSVYVRARRASGFFRDRRRRQVQATLPVHRHHIPEADGFIVLPPTAYEETAAIVGEAGTWLDRFLPAQPPRGKNRKDFLQNILDSSTLTRSSAAVRLALREDLLATVTEYLGVVPVLSTISVFVSAGSEPSLKSSQLYHCDGDDVRQVKLFVFCSDVDLPSGPLTVLDATSTAAVIQATRYHFRQRLDDKQVHAVVGRDRERPIIGPAGTTALVDTSRCLHFGSRVATGAPARLAVMIQYQTPYSFMLPGRTRPFEHLADGSVTELQRLVLAG
jgi:hypothetical protein